jgi:hypothetical protein
VTITPVVFPDVELELCSYLRTTLADYGYPGIFVSNRRESQNVAVWVRRDGGPVLDKTRDAARVGINVYSAGATDAGVTALAATVAALMRAAPDGDPIVKVDQLSGPSPIPGSVPQRFMLFEVVTRGSDLAETP